MREIKFRAWSEDTREMVQVARLDIKEGTIHYENGIKSINREQELGFWWKPYVLMQYTGLKDKNGVEIFEGDIVLDRWANAYTPVFQNGIYMAYNPKNLMQNEPSTQFNIIWRDGCEIIGNIYENSDLLEV